MDTTNPSLASYFGCITAGAIGGLLATASSLARIRGIPHVDVIPQEPFLTLAGGISGALVGFLLWTLLRPRHRLSRLAVILVAVNWAAWLLYLASTPRISHDRSDPIIKQRSELDAQAERGVSSGMDLCHDCSQSLLAGRRLTWIELPEKPLGLMAGPAVAFVEELTVPPRYVLDTGATVAESFSIAYVSFVMSTAWWVAVASSINWFRSVRGRHRHRGDAT